MQIPVKLISTYVLFCVLIISCQSKSQDDGDQISTDVVHNPASADNANKAAYPYPSIEFEEYTYNFGRITEGDEVEHEFTFTNTGTGNLIITSVKPSCDCTVPTWPRRPIKPGQSNKIKVIYKSKGKSGMQHRTIEVLANSTPNKRILSIDAEVMPRQ